MRFASAAGFQFSPLSHVPSPLPTARIASILRSVGISTPSPVTVIFKVDGSNVTVTSQAEVTLNVTLSLPPSTPYQFEPFSTTLN